MKKLITIFFWIIAGTVYAQKMPELSLYKIHINQTDKTIVAEIKEVSKAPRLKRNVFYYWYSANAIHSTQGGYSGTLLNGSYNEYYLNKNIREQGNFKKGVKTGIWRSWDKDGMLTKMEKWKNGVLLKEGRTTFWKKIRPFSWLKKHAPADSIKHSGK